VGDWDSPAQRHPSRNADEGLFGDPYIEEALTRQRWEIAQRSTVFRRENHNPLITLQKLQ
jgi:hypothetical protein